KAELGITVSIGLSWNKIFAKFGSDYKKPDAITVITPENYRDIVWSAPVEDLLYVGPATKRKLNRVALFTIGDIANAPLTRMHNLLGKMGDTIWGFANGLDTSPVKPLDPHKANVDYLVKSIGNGLTAPRDLVSKEETKLLIYILSESVAQRLRECDCRAHTIGINVRHADLGGYVCQKKLEKPTHITLELANHAFALLASHEPLDGGHPIRSLAVRASELVHVDTPMQLDLFGDEERRYRHECLDKTIDDLRRRFGNNIVRRACTLGDAMSALDIKRDNIVHPVGFFAS
ncbi:MAG: DNA polymerase IV, partial [Actinobacteria bacterium]|nr:DNA polymerase IV [Actinomycetota bacterium]